MAFLGTIAPTSAAQRMGSSLGQALGEGIKGLAEQKLNDLQSLKLQGEYQKAGLTPEEAYWAYQFRGNPTAQQKLVTGFLQNQQTTSSGEMGNEEPISQYNQPYVQESPFQLFNQPPTSQNFSQMLGGLPSSFLNPLQQKLLQDLFNPQAQQQQQINQPQPQSQPQRQIQNQQQQQPIQRPIQSQQQVPPQTQIQRPFGAPENYKAPEGKRPTFASNQQQIKRIEAGNKKYNEALDTRLTAARDVVDKGNQMLELLNTGEVYSGARGRFTPGYFLNQASADFDGLGDDAAASLAGLQTGVQTQSKIKFNKERKANLQNPPETQVFRTKNMIKTAEKILLEGDIRANLIANGQPENLSSKVGKIYGLLNNEIPDVPEGAEAGQSFVDPKTKAIWTVSGNRMEFDGFQGR